MASNASIRVTRGDYFYFVVPWSRWLAISQAQGEAFPVWGYIYSSLTYRIRYIGNDTFEHFVESSGGGSYGQGTSHRAGIGTLVNKNFLLGDRAFYYVDEGDAFNLQLGNYYDERNYCGRIFFDS
jgi:hypothetical protein